MFDERYYELDCESINQLPDYRNFFFGLDFLLGLTVLRLTLVIFGAAISVIVQKKLGEQYRDPPLECELRALYERHYKTITDDIDLGSGFQIGHSYFCTKRKDDDEHKWFEEVIDFEIKPLLEEIWFDDLSKVEDAISALRRGRGNTN